MYINNNFISKLETVNYYIDSFDANIELSKKLIMAIQIFLEKRQMIY